MKTVDVFTRFYTKPIDIYKNGERVCTINADVQRYSGGLGKKDYGFCKERRLRVFCSQNEFVCVGATAEFEKERYIIEDVFCDGLGACAVMRLYGGYDAA